MSVEISLLITGVSVAFAVFFGIATYRRNNRKDTEEQTENRATMNAMVMTKLDSISEDIKDMRRDFKDTQKEVQSLHDRVVIVEEALKRVDLN